MFTTLIALAALSFPADTPIEPITSDLIELGIETGLLDEMCDAFGPAVYQMDVAMGDPELTMFIADAVAVRSFEQGYDEAARMTVEAEEVFLDYLHTCI